MAAKVAAKVGPIGPLQSLPGTGGPEFFKVADKLGWQGSYTPEDFCSAYEVSKAVNNPVLVRNLPAEATSAQVELAAKAFGKASEKQLGTCTCSVNDSASALRDSEKAASVVGLDNNDCPNSP